MKIVQGHVGIIMGYGLVVDIHFMHGSVVALFFLVSVLPLFAEERFRSGKVLK